MSMATIHFWHWLMDFLGINNTYDSFSTHMYNFWSGFGGNVSILALAGTLVAVYRHYRKDLKSIHPIKMVEKPLQFVRHKDQDK
jgi:arabinogalactan endo-1,4-beta-galactosidase